MSMTEFREQDLTGAHLERVSPRSATDEQLAAEVTGTEPGWSQMERFPFKECRRVILNEEWEHRLYAERDLIVLEKED
jgi:hypothetical protein